MYNSTQETGAMIVAVMGVLFGIESIFALMSNYLMGAATFIVGGAELIIIAYLITPENNTEE